MTLAPGSSKSVVSKTLIGIPDMLRCVKEHGLKPRTEVTNWSGLLRTTLPAIAGLRDGGFLIAANISQDQLLIQHPASRIAATRNFDLVAIRVRLEGPPSRDDARTFRAETQSPLDSIIH